MKLLNVLLSIGWLLGSHSLLVAGDTFGNAGLVAWWTFDAKDTDWNANTTTDVSGHGNIGMMTNMSLAESSIKGKVGEALFFDGHLVVSSGIVTAVNLASSPIVNVSTPSSVCLWAYTTDISFDTGGYNQTMVNFFTDNSTGIRMASCWQTGQLITVYQVGGTAYGVQSDNQVFVNNTWTHVCYVWDGSTVTLYVNGSAVSTSGNFDSHGLENVIGTRDTENEDGCWSGGLDEILVFNRALSANEVQAIYNAGGAGLVAASTVQPSLPTYGSCPAPEPGKGLIVITHGWIPLWDDPAVDMAWVDQMSNSIVQYLDNNGLGNEWQVFGYKWPSWNNGAHVLTPTAALSNGEQYGKKLGDSIVALNGWSQIHFIAHSAGAGLIQKATEEIKATLPATVIQCTFLDAFDGAFLEKTGVYGNQADWADSYFSRDSTREWTEQPLPHAYNVDVTTLDPQATQKQLSGYTSATDPGAPCYETESSHGWPIAFYSNTIAGGPSVYRWSDYNGFGWPLSEECGNWGFATSQYLRGNGVSYGATMILGPEDGPCTASLYVTTPAYSGSAPSFSASSTIQSDTGTLQIFPGSFKPQTDSPVWIATVITDTNTLNIVSFDAEFTSAAGADGLLSVYWDTNMIGLVDEAAVQPGFQHYSLSFPNAAPNTSHVLGFHLDPFSSVQSSMILTNIVTGCEGVSQPFSLSITANTGNGLLVYQLTGQPANYTVQASTDLLNWTNIAILANTTGTVRFADPNTTNHPCCFYRVVTQ